MRKILRSLTRPLSMGNRTTPERKEKTSLLLVVWFFILFITAAPSLYAQTVAISGSTVVCANSSHMYTTTYTAGYTYVWSVFGAAGNSSSNNTFVVTYGQPPVGTGGNCQITLVVMNSTGSIVATGSLVTHVNPTPMPEIVTLSSMGCNGSPVEYDINIPLIDSTKDYCYKVCDSTMFKYKVGSTFDPNHNYVWSVIPASAAIAISATNSIGEAEVSWGAPSGTNSYILRLTETDPLTGCSDSVDICVRIISRPNAAMSTFPAPDMSGVVNICFNSSVAFFDQSTSDPNSQIVSYLWDFGDGTYSTQQFPTHIYTSSGTFYAKLIVENQCHCRDSIIVEINVDGQPGPDIYCVSPTCYNTSDTYCTTYSCTTYNWSVTNGTITSASSNTACIDVSWGVNGPGSIVLTPDPSCGGCPYPSSVLVPILTPTSVVTGPNPACENQISYYSVPNVPATSYNWQVLPAGTATLINGQGTNVLGLYFGAGPVNATVQVVYTNLFLKCSGSAQLAVKVAPKMTLVGDSILCSGVSGNYTSNSSAATWWVASPSGTTAIGSGVSGVSYSFPAPGAYVIYAQDLTGNYCATPQACQVQVIAQPPAPSASINTVICKGSVIQYVAAPSNNNYFLHWQVTGGTPSQTSGNAISVLWGNTAPWSMTLTQQQVMPPGCVSNPLAITMNTPTIPTPTINTSNATPCFNQSVNYSSAFAASGYTWQLLPSTIGSIAQGAGSGNIVLQYNNSTSTTALTASLFLIVETCGSTNSTVLTVTVGSPGTPTITASNLCTDQSVSFGTTTGPSGTYAWNFGDGSTGSGGTPVHTYTNAAPYTVSLTVTNPNGCIGTVSTATIININQTPLANITSPDQLLFCDPGALFNYNLYAVLQTLGTSPTYTWENSSGPLGYSSSQHVNQPGTYTLTVMANGCVYNTTVLIDDNYCNPSVPCTPNTTPSTLTIDYTLSCNSATFGLSNISPAGNLVQWTFEPNNQINTSANPVITYTASGYYNASVTYEFPGSPGGWCAITFNTVVLVPVVADFKHSLTCGASGMDVTFIDQSNWIGATPSFSWATTPGSYNSSLADYTVTNMPPNTYVVTHTATSSSPPQTCIVTKTVVVPSQPTAAFTATNSICEKNPVIFVNTSTPTTGIAQYYWDFGDYTSLITQNPGPNGVRAYDYTGSSYSASLTITDIYGCQSTFGSVVIKVHENEFTSVVSNSAVISPTLSQLCNGSSTNICVVSTNTNTPFSYMWNTFATTSCNTASQSGVYSVVMYDSHGCKSNKSTSNVNVISVPPPVIFGKQSYCEGNEPLMSINKGTGYNYQWIYSTTNSSMISSPGSYTSTACSSPLFPPTPSSCALSPALNPNATGTLALTGLITETSSGLNCQAQWGVVTITIHPLPPAPTVGTNACETGGFISLNATPTGTGTVSSILWNTGQQGSPINVISSGQYWAAVIDNHGCKSANDTTNIWPLPDFNSLIYGCYDICDTGTTLVPVPYGSGSNYYTSYEWIKQGVVGAVAGPNGYYTPLVLNDPSTMPDLTNEGVYQLVLTTNHGCIDTSKTIAFKEKKCVSCDAALYIPQFDNIVCVYDPVTGAPSYNFQISITNPYGSPANFSLTTGSGNLNLIPSVTTLAPGANILTGNFIPILGLSKLCVHFTIKENLESICDLNLCVDLPVCNTQLPPCSLEDPDLQTWCINATNGVAEYGYNFNFNYMGSYAGTVTMSSNQGFMNQSTTIVNPGWNSISGTFTDTPLLDGTVCFDIVIESVDDDMNPIWCQDRVCVELDPNPPCQPNLPACSLSRNPGKSICYYKNSFGQIAYVIDYNINNGSSATYSFYVLSSQGILGAPSPAYIYPGANSYTQSFLETNPTTPQCFTIIATNLANGKQCRMNFCINPQPCDPAQLRLAATINVNLYPNPSNNYAIAEYAMDSEELADRFTLIDMSGRVIQEIRLQDTRGKVEFNTSSLEAGMYFMKIMNAGQTVMVKKLIIQR